MYSRNFYTTESEKTPLPESYGGTAFAPSDTPDVQDTCEEIEETVSEAADVSAGITKGQSLLSGLFGDRGFFGISSLKLPKIGTEEILIIAAALFLIFSKDGDLEIALMLLALLLIG